VADTPKKKPEYSLAQARKEIKRAIVQRGPFSHNICSLVLRHVSQVHGLKAANSLVDELSLKALFGICKEKEDDNKEV
jgi:hypothetical protein